MGYETQDGVPREAACLLQYSLSRTLREEGLTAHSSTWNG